MIVIVPMTVALALAILGYALTGRLVSMTRHYEEEYLKKANSALDALHSPVDARVVWQASLVAALIGLLLGYTTGYGLVAVVLAIVGALTPLAYLRMLQKDRKGKFHQQLPDLIAQVRTAVACGYTFTMALQMAQRQLAAPMSQEIKVVLGHMRLGVPLAEALGRLQQRMPGEDIDLLVGAILMAERAGGQLNSVLFSIETAIRERLRLERKLRAMTARGRMESWIITVAPGVLAFLLYIMNPDLMGKAFAHPLALPVAAVSAIWMAVGYVIMRRILTPEF